jgi:peptidoglycan hydrolase-like protein with peptidoglycan-binding domain
MKALALLVTGTLVFGLTATQISAQAGDPAHVERAQKALKQAGHDPGPVDGVMGAQTSAALRAYQKAHGLSATGRLDDATLAKLGEPVKSPSASPRTGGPQETGGDTKPNAVDPAQATKTGANAGEGASYSRSTEKGQSTLPK